MIHRTLTAAALLCLSIAVIADTTVGQLEPTSGTWRAYRGSGFTTLVCSAGSEDAALACADADAERRAVSTRYQIRYPNRYVMVRHSAPVVGTVTLSWTPPTQNTDGTALSDLAGVRIVYGRDPSALTQTIQIANPAITNYTVSGLAGGTWHFGVRAYTTGGTESETSNVMPKVIAQ